MRRRGAERRLATLVEWLARKNDPMDRAAVAAEIRDVAEGLVSSSIRDANREGMTWRQIGAELDIPFQTLYRRYGETE